MKLIGSKDLKARGVNFTPPTLAKLEAAGQWPKRVQLSAKKPAWIETEIDAHIAKLAAARG